MNGMDDPDDFAVIEGGAGQGQADSPLIWVVVMDIPITYAQAHGGRGYAVGRTEVQTVVFMDDVSAADSTREGFARTMEASTLAMAALGIRMGPPKFLATWSPAADAAGQGLDRHPVRVAALLPDGTYGMVQFNPVPPHGDPTV